MPKYRLIAVFAGFSSLIHASNLGPAEAYNTFIFGNINQTNIDAQGMVAAGGNVTYSNFMVGTNLSYVAGMDDLVVGGLLTATNLTVQHGGVAIGSSTGASQLLDPTIAGDVSTYGNLQLGSWGQIGYGGGNPFGVETGGTLTNNYNNSGAVSIFGSTGNLPIATGVDFASAQASLTQESLYWASLPSLAPVVSYGTISVTGTSSTLNVFDISGSALASANGLNISAPSGSTVLLNISGTTDSLSNFQINLSGTDDYHVLYNFYQATSINDANVSIEGSLLAPYAAFSGGGSHINGTLIAASLSGQLEQHLYLFQGNLPSVPTSSTPEPGALSMVILGAGLIALSALRHRANRNRSHRNRSNRTI